MARLTSPTGTTVNVADDKVEALTRRGFKPVEESAPKTPAKRAASRKSEN
jgi:hypothetical protein